MEVTLDLTLCDVQKLWYVRDVTGQIRTDTIGFIQLNQHIAGMCLRKTNTEFLFKKGN